MACTQILPVVSFNDACQTIKRGQVYKLFMTTTTTGDGLTDVESLVEWTARLNNSVSSVPGDPNSIREFTGIGSWGAGEVTDIQIALDETFSFPGSKVLNFKVLDLTAENLAAIIAYRDAGTSPARIWTQFDDQLMGGNSGIIGTIRADLVVPEGRTDYAYGEFVFTTKNSINEVVTTPHAVL